MGKFVMPKLFKLFHTLLIIFLFFYYIPNLGQFHKYILTLIGLCFDLSYFRFENKNRERQLHISKTFRLIGDDDFILQKFINKIFHKNLEMVQGSSPAPSTGKSTTSKVIKDFILGGTSGAIAKTLAAPIERVKLLLQTQENNPKLKDRPYKGIVDCFQRCIKQQGFVSLWRGNWANVLRYFPTQAINFSVKDALNRVFLEGVSPVTDRSKYFMMSLLSGGLAGSFSLIFVYPLDFARTRLGADIGKAAGERQFNGLFDCCRKILVKDGIQGLYQGFFVSVLGIFTYRAFYFGGYDAGKSFIWGNSQQQKKASFMAKFAFAQFVTSTSETLAYPLDTIRRRLMMESGKATADRKYKGTVDCATKILSTEGFTGFFKGNLSNFWRSIGSSLVLVLYDELQKFVEHKGY